MTRPHIYHSPCYKLSLGGKNKLPGDLPGALIKGTNTPTPFPAVFQAQTPVPTLAPAPTISSIEKLCQQFLKTYTATMKLLEQNEGSSFYKQPLKTWFFDFYYHNLYIDCYHICQQCEYYFETIRISRLNRILFTTSFFYGIVV